MSRKNARVLSLMVVSDKKQTWKSEWKFFIKCEFYPPIHIGILYCVQCICIFRIRNRKEIESHSIQRNFSCGVENSLFKFNIWLCWVEENSTVEYSWPVDCKITWYNWNIFNCLKQIKSWPVDCYGIFLWEMLFLELDMRLAGAKSRKPICPMSDYNQITKKKKTLLNYKSSILSCIIVQA